MFIFSCYNYRSLTTIVPFDESVFDELSAEEQVANLSRAKAAHIAEGENGDTIVIGADTVVALDNVVLGKPSTEEEAKRKKEAAKKRTKVKKTEKSEDAEKADAIFTKLMGDQAEMRKNFIQARAASVNLDDLDF